MDIEQLRALVERLRADKTQVSDDDLAAARTAIREQVDGAKGQAPSEEVIKLLTELKDVRAEVQAVQDERAQQLASQEDAQRKLLAEFDEPETPEQGDTPEGGEPAAEQGEKPAPAAQGVTVRASTPELAEVLASLATNQNRLTELVASIAGRPGGTPVAEQRPQGRAGRPGGQAPTVTTARGDVVTAKAYAGKAADGSPLGDSTAAAKALHDQFRGAYQVQGFSGRIPVLHVQYDYPESRTLGQNAEENSRKIDAVTQPSAIVAAGGLCAPLETLYDVEVIGSADRPIKAALTPYRVERGGISYRPPISAAAAVHGAGVWTLQDDQADPLGTKTCYVVDCPGMHEEVVEAIYSCLEFSNITTRFDPEATKSNIDQGAIAHARLAEQELWIKLVTGAKVLSAPKVVGATRDVLVNLDKSVAYFRDRHRITDAVSLTFMLPGWVKSLMRADIARQMAAGDWMEALALSDQKIAQWFAARGVTPVWRLDGAGGTNEVQTVTISGSPTGGTFTLTYNGSTTAPIAYNATAATVRSALEALPSIGQDDVTVTGTAGGPYTVTFDSTGPATGAFGGQNVAQMTTASSLTGGSSPSVAVATTTGGGGAITAAGISIVSQAYADAPSGTVLPGFPDQIDGLLYQTGTQLFLDGGSLDLGLVRDHILNARNRYRQFMETFEGVADRGVEKLRLVMSVQPTGETVGTVSGSGIND